MLLESITLENFRQFRHESIDFAQGDNGKNVTIIIGENGTGKTTFAQAFFWCMYGETEFSDKNMLNKLVAAEMKPGQESKVQVILKLRHGTVNYTLMREQTYRKDYSNRVKGDNTVFDIAIKDANGNTSYVKKSQCESEVKGILPKELSRYFFFDGERIEKMSKDISTGKKATDFAEAVKGLLGLNAMYSAIQHFNPKSRLGVIGSYESSYDSHSNSKIQEYTQTIERCKSEIAKIDARLEELEGQIEQASARKAEKTEEIKQYAEGEELQRQKERLIQKIARAKDSKQYRFRGRHAVRVDALTSVFDSNSKAKLFDRNVDVYANAPLVGFLYGRTAEQDDTRNPETNQVYNQNVMGDRVIYSQEELQFNFRLIMLLDKDYEPNEDERIDKAFKHMGENPDDEARFDSYVRGGVDVLYEKLIEGVSSPDEYVTRLYDFIEEFQEKFNDEISSDDILKLCSK